MSQSNPCALITGGAGFIGSELSRQLCRAGYRVNVVDDLTNGSRENLEGVDCSLSVADIRDSSALRPLLNQADVVYHLACLGVRHSIHSPLENHQVNAEATLKLLIQCRELGVGRFVYVSTSEVYGTAKTVPMTEEHPAFPMTVYGASKLAGECYTRAFWETYRYPTVVVRPFNSYGPRSHHEGDSGEVIPKFLLRLLADRELIIFGDGKQTRDFTFVADTARGIMLSGQCEQALGQTINIGSGKELSMNRLAEIAMDVVGKPNARVTHIEPRPGDVLRLYANCDKAEKFLGFRPEVSFGDGLQRLLSWYQQNPLPADKLLESEVTRNWEPAGL